MATSNSQPDRSVYDDQPLGPGEIRLLALDVRKGGKWDDMQTIVAAKPMKDRPQMVTTSAGSPAPLPLVTRVFKLDEIPEFDAISYVWGTALPSVALTVNGYPFLVTPTAYEMLEHLFLFRENQNRPIWVDAICINQANTEEKALQIPLMRRIYRNAAEVVIWFGRATRAILRFMDLFRSVAELSKSWTPKTDLTEPFWRGEDWPVDNDAFWIGAYELLNHDWFKRLWTCQEVLLARNPIILCGPVWIHATDFVHFVTEGYFSQNGYFIYDPRVAASALLDVPQLKETTFANPKDAVKLLSKMKVSKLQLAFDECHTIRARAIRDGETSSSILALPDLFSRLQYRQCKEPVDRIWAIAGLMDDNFQEYISSMVDYSEQGLKEYWTTYNRFVTVVVSGTRSLTLVELPPTIDRHPALPSWCPDFSKELVCEHLMMGSWNMEKKNFISNTSLFLFDKNDHENATERKSAIMGHPRKLISVYPPTNVLQARGFVVDVITKVVEDPRLFCRRYNANLACDMRAENYSVDAITVGFLTRALALARRVFADDDSKASGSSKASKRTRALALARRVFKEDNTKVPVQFLMAIMLDCRVLPKATEAFLDAWAMMTTEGPGYFDRLEQERSISAALMSACILQIIGHSFFSTRGGRFGIAHPGCKPGDQVCAIYGAEPLYILRDPVDPQIHPVHKSVPVQFCGCAFIPFLMEQPQRDAARLTADEVRFFV